MAEISVARSRRLNDNPIGFEQDDHAGNLEALMKRMQLNSGRRNFLPIVLALSAAGVGTVLGQNVFNGSFESGVAPPLGGEFIPAPNSGAIAGWTVQSGSVDHIGSDTWPAAEGSRSLDLNGHDAGTIVQTISGFVPGRPYRLAFRRLVVSGAVALILRRA